MAETPIVGADIRLRRVDCESLVDNVRRAASSARAAQKLAGAAAKAFGEEACVHIEIT